MSHELPLNIELSTWQQSEAVLREIRTEVFIAEQSATEDEEFDGKDPQALHAIAYLKPHTPIGCARLLSDGFIGRVAVLAHYRNNGVGQQLVNTLMQEAVKIGFDQVRLNAQVQAMAFYQKQGFEPCNQPSFLEAGIMHQTMQKTLEDEL